MATRETTATLAERTPAKLTEGIRRAWVGALCVGVFGDADICVVQEKVTRVENVVGFREPHVWVASGGDTVITLHVVVNDRAVEQEVSVVRRSCALAQVKVLPPGPETGAQNPVSFGFVRHYGASRAR